MKKYYEEEKAVIYASGSSITVYGETARLINTVVGFTVLIASLALISKILK